MAGDWIKLEAVTPDKPEIYAIAGHLNCSHGEAFLACVRLWVWADSQSRNGHDLGVTKKTIDHVSGVPGFADALSTAGWLLDKKGVLSVPNFDRHNGKTAKERALATKRKVTERSRLARDENATREEKRRINKRKDVFDAAAILLPEWLSKTAWGRWVADRKERRKSVTRRGAEAQIVKLEQYRAQGFTPEEVIDHSIANCYQGLFPPSKPKQSESPIYRREGVM